MNMTAQPPSSWKSLIEAFDNPPEWIVELGARHAEPHRRYHGVAHIDALARLYAEVAAGPGWLQPTEVAAAILFHDAIYDPGRADNEAQSAHLARARLQGRDDVDVERVVELIEATAAHGGASTEADPDLGHFLDADVAILGAPPDVYDRYAQGVFEEFAPIVDADRFRAGRRAFLQAQLARPALFHTRWFAERHEAQARANISRELATLGGR